MIVADDRVAKFVSEKLGFGLCPPFTCMGIERNGEIIAGVIMNVFESEDVHISAVGRGWDRAFLEAWGDYTFNTIGCHRATMITESEYVAKLAVRLGGKIEGRLREHFGHGRDAIVVGVLAREYRYAKVTDH